MGWYRCKLLKTQVLIELIRNVPALYPQVKLRYTYIIPYIDCHRTKLLTCTFLLCRFLN